MESTTYTVDGREFELQHYGVKGMKWGVRKTRKWATSKHQPSSARSSALAGIYAATGSKRVGKALDKSNDRDAADWQRAKKEYKDYSKRKAEDKRFKEEVKYYKKNGMNVDYKVDKALGTLTITGYRDSHGKKIEGAYANAIMARGNAEKTVAAYVGTTVFMLGASAVAAALGQS